MPSQTQAQYPLATWSPSPSHSSRDDTVVDLVIIHQTDGTPRAEQTVEGFQKPENHKSAHFVVGQAGEVYQLVELERAAWHDAGRNKRSIGIEHAARTPGEFDAKWPGLSEHTRLALLPNSNADEAASSKDPGFALTDAQLQASARLVAWLLRRYDLTIEQVVPHCSSPMTTHKDCGRDVADGGIWPWAQYRGLIADALAVMIPPMQPV